MLQDLRYGLRMLVNKPAFTAVAVAALSLGIGVNSAVFSVVNSVLLRPIPLSHSDRLVMLWNRSPGLNVLEDWLSPAEYFDIKQAGSFDAAAIAFVNTVNLTDLNSDADDRPERVGGAQVSSSLFAMLEAKPALGRLFLPEEDQPGNRLTTVISNALWRRRFSSDPVVIGKSVTLDGKEYSVIGVLPADFGLNNETLPAYHPVEDVDVFMALPLAPAAAQDRRHEDFTVLARLKPNVSATQAQAEIDTIVARLRHDYPQNYPPNAGFTISVVPVLQHAVGGIRPLLLILLGAVAFVLLIACANVANLLLSRAAARRHEIAIRTAMGASRLRLVRQFLMESLLLALTGGALGLVLTFWGVHGLRVLNPANVPRIAEIAVDGRVVGFTLAVSLLTGILFGLVPALRASQIHFNEMLKEGGRDRMGGAHARGARGLLVVSEIALSLILLAGAGLLIRSFLGLQAVSPGFNTSNVLSLHLGLAGSKYAKPESRGLFY
ncbi:MAG: ABC transporter permease, partial [Blastocatellia bacterium]